MPPVVRYLLARLGGLILVLWAVATIVFLALKAVPGDEVDAILGPGSNASAEAVALAIETHGLDQPLLVQYWVQLKAIATFDWGTSFSYDRPVTELIGEQLPSTLTLSLAALALAWVMALIFALISVFGRRTWRVMSMIEVVSAALPHFALAIVLIVIFSTWLGLLPPVSTDSLDSLILPALTLAVPTAGFLGQIMRESMLDALEAPFTTSARARGESTIGLFARHLLRHAVLPAVSLAGWAFGSLMSGAVIVEEVFARQGIGRTLLGAVSVRDMPLVIGILMVIAAVYVAVMLLVDVAEAAIDPRVRRPA
ncbi:ABC transporter permease [Flaviflexus salsibiostraticola]|uniref:ABC transporter permease n=1 Tax=Flaviflexus salsibiostraticola TaxID=1282737 RepID=A0A3Q8WSR1_9ACTO|nr:ABC transporter permease [Flaviflexus salsibiostraticola]AZN29325.1 ABC transporter permease [Flaviflexus salsibiostraticola]